MAKPPAPRQLAFALPHAESFSPDDFLAGPSNADALHLIERWPDWPGRSVVLVGPEGAGKSHLAAIWADAAGARFLSARALGGAHLPATLATGALVVEDLSAEGFDERPLFHLLNLAREHDAFVLLTARTPPAGWKVQIADLASRLRALPVVALASADDALLRAVLPPRVACRGVATDLGTAERLTMADAFSRYVGADLLATADDAPALAASAGAELRPGESWEDLFFRLLLERIEPRIGRDRPTFLTHWPAAQAALARRDPADPRVAERFELWVCGMELANAFVELTDAGEQRARFLADRARRAALYGDAGWEMDEAFLAALAHGMPPAAGIALGFDRLAMIAAGAPRIGDVTWLP